MISERKMFRINNIYHSGTIARRWAERVDDTYPSRKGRLVSIGDFDIIPGARGMMRYEHEDGVEDYPHEYLSTTMITDVEWCGGKLLVSTLNSIYELSEEDLK